MEANDLTVNYVDAPPGTGKTRACIEMMRRHIVAGAGGKAVGYLFYVAPTVDLLRQTIRGLRKRVPAQYHTTHIRAVQGGELRRNKDRTEHQVYNILSGREFNSLEAVPFKHGSILFLTHATFLKLKKHKKFAHTTVVFDESRKWIERQNLKMDLPGVKNLFDALFDVRPLQAYSGINELVAKAVSENVKSDLISTKASAREFTKLDILHTSLSEVDGPVRLKVYAVMSGKTMIQVLLPSHPFVGFREVYILSAGFERSQMYHLFKSENCKLVSATRVFMNTYLKHGYGEAINAIGERQSRLEIVPLLEDEGVPSKYQLMSGVIVPRANVLAMTAKKDELAIDTQSMRDVIAHLKDPLLNGGRLRDNHRKLLKEFKRLDVKHDILGWHIRAAERMARQWFAKRGQPHEGLLFVNKANEEVRHNKKLLSVVSIGKAEGNNGYAKSNLVVFLAAVNPEPEIVRILKTLLPDYDPNEDYVIDKAIQCIGRGNIRNHNVNDRMLAIVSTKGMAEAIGKIMNYAPIIRYDITEHLGSYVTWSANLASAEKAKEEKGSKEARRAQGNRNNQKNYRSNPLNRRLANLRAMRSKAKKAGNTEVFEKTQLEIEQLLRERDEQKKWSTENQS